MALMDSFDEIQWLRYNIDLGAEERKCVSE